MENKKLQLEKECDDWTYSHGYTKTLEVDVKKTKMFEQESKEMNTLLRRENEIVNEINTVKIRTQQTKESVATLNSNLLNLNTHSSLLEEDLKDLYTLEHEMLVVCVDHNVTV